MHLFKAVLIVSVFVLFGVTVLYGRSSKENHRWVRLFFIYLTFSLITNLISKWFWFYGINNLLYYQIVNLFKLGLLTLFYLNFNKGRIGKLILYSAISVACIMISSGLFVYDYLEFNVVGYFAFKFFLIILSLREMFLHKMHQGEHRYYINLGLMLTSAVNVATLSFINILVNYDTEMQLNIWIFNALMYVVALICYGVEILRFKKWKSTS